MSNKGLSNQEVTLEDLEVDLSSCLLWPSSSSIRSVVWNFSIIIWMCLVCVFRESTKVSHHFSPIVGSLWNFLQTSKKQIQVMWMFVSIAESFEKIQNMSETYQLVGCLHAFVDILRILSQKTSKQSWVERVKVCFGRLPLRVTNSHQNDIRFWQATILGWGTSRGMSTTHWGYPVWSKGWLEAVCRVWFCYPVMFWDCFTIRELRILIWSN